jgi:hypothetical protein
MSEDQKTDVAMGEIQPVVNTEQANTETADAKPDVPAAIPVIEGQTEEEVKALMAKAAKQSTLVS